MNYSVNKLDKLGREPQVGSLICYNPPRYKGIVIAKVIAFNKSGSPISVDLEDYNEYEMDIFIGIESPLYLQRAYGYTPRTGFVVVQ